MSGAAPRLAMAGVAKAYGAVRALDGVDFTVAAGEIHALVGENGAGKSTLMKVLSGAVVPDAGTIAVDGVPLAAGDPAAARAAGIGIVRQDLELVPGLSVAENVLLGLEPTRGRTPLIDRAALHERARAALAEAGAALDPRALVGDLPVAERQLVEIARALARRVAVLALDEPTAPLTDLEAGRLFDVVRRLAAAGVAVIYISHRLEEVFALAARITVLRDGAVVATGAREEFDGTSLVRAMVGRALAAAPERAPAAAGELALRARGVCGGRVAPADLELRRGEIVGLAGLVGSGRSELVRLLFGADPRAGGSIEIDGRAADPRSPREAIALGIALLTEDRNRLGLVGTLDVARNVTLAALGTVSRGPLLDRRLEHEAAAAHAARLSIKPPDPEAPVFALSGGNRQKVVLARWLQARARVLIFDEPTAGVDVGAKREIHDLIGELAAGGAALLIVSSDLPELLAVCDRILVMREGRIVGELARAAATQEAIMHLATGHAA